MRVSRREVLRTAGLGVAGVALAAFTGQPILAQAAGPFTLPPLPYGKDALEPAIDTRTMEIHHDRHHQAYVTNLNAAIAKAPDLGKKSIDEILKNIKDVPMEIRQAVINNGGGHYNHSLFWKIMQAPQKDNAPAGNLARAIDSTFQSFANFKSLIKTAATGRFGSGWAWLVKNGDRLEITSTANQDCPLMEGKVPLLGLDVWEHAYYLKYQNARADYIDAWWSVVNWTAVADRM